MIGDVVPELRSVRLGDVVPDSTTPRAPMPHVSAVRGGALLGVDLPASRGVSLARTSGRELSSPQLFLALSLGRFGVQEHCGSFTSRL